jgi:uncharacterized protein YbbC (DUF1343 family)
MLRVIRPLLSALLLLSGLLGCSSARAPAPAPAPVSTPAPSGEAVVVFPGPGKHYSPPSAPTRPSVMAAPTVHPVMLGIDVLAAEGYALLRGKRVGLLTHPAGVDRAGRSTIDHLHRAPGVKLVALFAPEHALDGAVKAGENFEDQRHAATGLPVYSLHGSNRKPTAAQLRGLDAFVVDLQDIGVRSYTFSVVMRYALDACFAAGVEVVVLDRPNPLGGYKVDGPLLDRELFSGVGAFRIPYVHGLTMGELARYAAGTPGGLEVPEAVRERGRLTVVPMRGWHRGMRWPETGLRFVPTSPMVRDFPAVIGYAMVGLGCEHSGFKHGAGKAHPFRAISYKGRSAAQLKADLEKLKIPGVAFRVIEVPDPKGGAPGVALYVDIADWEAWQPTRLSFELMRLAARYDASNPFARLSAKDARSFNIHVGSLRWWEALKRDGANVDLPGFWARWQSDAAAYQAATRRFWLYP